MSEQPPPVEEENERKVFATFEKHDEFVKLQNTILALDLFEEPDHTSHDEWYLLQKFSVVLDEFQEQSYLLDPYLEELVTPVVDHIKTFAKAAIADPERVISRARVQRLAQVLYLYVKCRGYKHIIRFFPHEIADLSIAINFLELHDAENRYQFQWALRYVVLIWLSLVCMLPFDLAQFDEVGREGETVSRIEGLAKRYLPYAGVERTAAAILLARLYVRQDTKTQLLRFLQTSQEEISGKADVLTAIGLLQAICEIVKSAPTDLIQSGLTSLLGIGAAIDSRLTLTGNTILRKLRIKLLSWIALRCLPPPSDRTRKARLLAEGNSVEAPTVVQDEGEVPECVEMVLEQLFDGLQDKDTIVRYPAAKGVARISERLPADFVHQVFETVLGHFAIHSQSAAAISDIPAIAEATWHGACLACAEIARRGLVPTDKLAQLIEWMSKALYFDVRKGAHSIGSNVRDAASYVLWALARTQDHSALLPHSANLARHLVTVAVYDREVHIRRAASAAFQEHVGRTSLFPHGIDTLRETDFYVVSVRRNAFIEAAPRVAQYPEYRYALFDHIFHTLLRHWDISVRELGSQSLRKICEIDVDVLGPRAIEESSKLLSSIDTNDVHGGLLALSEVATAYENVQSDRSEGAKQQIFGKLALVPTNVLFGTRNEIVTAAACRLAGVTITQDEIELERSSPFAGWKKLIDQGLKGRSALVQEQAAQAMSSISKLVDCSAIVTSTLIEELPSGSTSMQQGLGQLIAAIDYESYPDCLGRAVKCVLESVKVSTVPLSIGSNIEARRNCYIAMPAIINNVIPHLTQRLAPNEVQAMYIAMEKGLEDYSIDERGDVGSWVRMVCIQGVATISESLIRNAGSIPDFESYLPPSGYHRVVAAILRQGVGRLDNVRRQAGVSFLRLLSLPSPECEAPERWRLPGVGLLQKLFSNEGEVYSWSEGQILFPKILQLLAIPEYHDALLSGLVFSLGGKTDSVQRPLAASLAAYVQELPVKTVNDKGYDIFRLLEALAAQARVNLSSNLVVIPVLQAVNTLLDLRALAHVAEDPVVTEKLNAFLAIASRNVARLKSTQRIHESMKIVIHLLQFPPLFESCTRNLVPFLAHQFPTIRADAAEKLYLALQDAELDREIDEVEELLLETEWSASADDAKVAADRVVRLLLEGPGGE